MASRFELLNADWKDCRRCSYAGHRQNVCMVRGQLPADVLFIGQAPGISENALGLPFQGPAGILLDSIIEAGLGSVNVCLLCGTTRVGDTSVCVCGGSGAERPIRYAITNLVGCIPPPDDHGKEGEPDHEAIEACRPRLQGLIDIVNPRLVVRVGAFARKWVAFGFKGEVRLPDGCKVIDIDHPGSMLPHRAPVAQRGFMLQRATVTLSQAVEDI